MHLRIASWLILCSFVLSAATRADDLPPNTVQALANKTSATANKAHDWTKPGVFVYRASTPDVANVLPTTEQGIKITNHLLDDSIKQIIIMNGIIGHDHPGICNWDGNWPNWNRVTYRGGDWKSLADFMQQVKDQDNAAISFHVNFTDVNYGLRDYPESQAFFKKLVAAKAIYRRDRNPATGKRDIEPPYVPQEIPNDNPNPVPIFALVNYKNFWDSGLAKQMIDEFYGHLPYAPPILYCDVLTMSGANFSTGYPDGPLGGSHDTQLEGAINIAKYLRSKGTDLATEGDRPELSSVAGYGWLHCHPGYSSDDYSYIAGASRDDAVQQVAGDTGGFNLSPISSTPEILAKVREHYANLLAGKPDAKIMPSLETDHLADRGNNSDEFDMCPAIGTGRGIPGDQFRGDWADLIDNFYLTGIQEAYHIGKGNYRTNVFYKSGVLHVTRFGFVDEQGKETPVSVADFAPPSQVASAKKSGRLMLADPLPGHFNAPQAGKYKVILYGGNPGNNSGAVNIYVNGQLQQTALDVHFPSRDLFEQPYPLGEITLNAGDNTIAFDCGPIYMKWSDGTEALWTTPYLHKGLKITNGDVTFADDYDRMWPDTWSGQQKIYFFSWDGTSRAWKLPQDWATRKNAMLYPLTPDGRGKGIPVDISDRNMTPKLLPQVPYVLVPAKAD